MQYNLTIKPNINGLGLSKQPKKWDKVPLGLRIDQILYYWHEVDAHI